jgi:hypothetical protein
VTIIQHFGGALNLNTHFHMLFLNVVYVVKTGPSLVSGNCPVLADLGHSLSCIFSLRLGGFA